MNIGLILYVAVALWAFLFVVCLPSRWAFRGSWRDVFITASIIWGILAFLAALIAGGYLLFGGS